MAPSLFDDPPPTRVTSGDEQTDPLARSSAGTPLAERMRPRNLDEVVGHDAVVGEHGFLRQAIEHDRVPSLVLWGPPGSGKTTLARIVARETAARFVPFSAVTSGIKEVKQVMAEAARLRAADDRQTLVFVDEIHRFNKAQQDAFLPYVEQGDIVLVGATTENPSFEVVSALLSRCRVVVLEPLSPASVTSLLRRALETPTRGLGLYRLKADDDTLASMAQLTAGDARAALNLLEVAAEHVGRGGRIDEQTLQRVAQRKILRYDKSGEEHYNLISALHKSLRESDVDASLYWFGRMLASGEDPRYVARRMLRFASEDIGMAAPRALEQTLAAWQAYERLGSPEGELALAQAVVFLALAPKSNAVYAAYKSVQRTLAERPADPVPPVIRNAPTRLMKDVGYGDGYVYAHDTEEGVGGLDCLPESLAGTSFYHPTERGFEADLRRRLAAFDGARKRARQRKPPAKT